MKHNGKRFEFEKSFIQAPDVFGAFRVYQMGEVCCEPGYCCEPHRQWCYEISCVLSGEGRSIVDGNEIPVSTGDIFLTPLNSYHIVKAETQFRYSFIGFDITDARGGMLDFFETPTLDVLKDTGGVADCLNECLNEYYAQSPCCRMMIEAYLTQLFVKVMRLYSSVPVRTYRAAADDSGAGISLYAVMMYIDSNICSLGSITDIAAKLSYSPCYLSHSFRTQTGMTLQEYICRRRIERSIRLIRSEGYTISQAAQKLGFSTPQAFSRAFSRVTGMPPGKYIASGAGEENAG